MRIYHISDLHYGAGEVQRKGFEDLIRHLISIDDGEGIIALSGDVVEGVRRSEWTEASKPLALLSVAYRGRLLIVPGNHDCSDNKGVTYDEAAAKRTRFYINALCPSFVGPNGLRVQVINGVKFIGIDTNIGNSDDWVAPLARGEIGLPQLAALELELQDNRETFIIMHHKPFATDILHTLEDRQSFFQIVSRRQSIRAVLYGHLHEWSVRDDKGVLYFESDNTTCSRRYRVIDSVTLEHSVVSF